MTHDDRQAAGGSRGAAKQAVIDALVATYRELNHQVRRLPEDRLRRPHREGGSVRDVVAGLRDRELRFSKAIKERLTGIPMPELFGEDAAPVIGTERADEPTRMLISEFGTAREATLAMLLPLSEEEWAAGIEGGQPIGARAAALAADDRDQLERIRRLLEAR